MTARKSINNVVNETLEIEFLGVEMDISGTTGCASCDSTRLRLDAAVEAARPLLDEMGINVKVTERYINTEEEVTLMRLQGSPTIRVQGYEIRPEHQGTKEDERVWTWQGQDHQLPPKAMILDTIFKGYAALTIGKQKVSENRVPAYIQQFLKPKATNITSNCGAQKRACD